MDIRSDSARREARESSASRTASSRPRRGCALHKPKLRAPNPIIRKPTNTYILFTGKSPSTEILRFFRLNSLSRTHYGRSFSGSLGGRRTRIGAIYTGWVVRALLNDSQGLWRGY